MKLIRYLKFQAETKTAANTLTITFRRIIQCFLQHNADVKQWCLTRLRFKNGPNFVIAGGFVYFFLKKWPLDYICT